jgi:hypothetical protein
MFCRETATVVLRSYLRQRAMLLTYAGQHIQPRQKALTQLNLKLHHVISDITGVTGFAIIRAILAGARAPATLAPLCAYRGETLAPPCQRVGLRIAPSACGDAGLAVTPTEQFLGRHGLSQQGAGLIRNSSSTPVSDAFIRPGTAYLVAINRQMISDDR